MYTITYSMTSIRKEFVLELWSISRSPWYPPSGVQISLSRSWHLQCFISGSRWQPLEFLGSMAAGQCSISFRAARHRSGPLCPCRIWCLQRIPSFLIWCLQRIPAFFHCKWIPSFYFLTLIVQTLLLGFQFLDPISFHRGVAENHSAKWFMTFGG